MDHHTQGRTRPRGDHDLRWAASASHHAHRHSGVATGQALRSTSVAHRAVWGSLPLVWEWERAQALEDLSGLRPASGDVPAVFNDAVRSLHTQQDWMGHDQAWKEQGYPVGSGLVERAGAVVINARMKQRGMHWMRPNATPVVA